MNPKRIIPITPINPQRLTVVGANASRPASAHARTSVLPDAARRSKSARLRLVAEDPDRARRALGPLRGHTGFQEAEKQMLRGSADATSPSSRNGLHDREHVMSFANLRGFDDAIKLHGITGATGDIPNGRVEPELARNLARPPEPVNTDSASVETTPPDPMSSADADAPGPPQPGGRAPLVSTGRVGTSETQRVTANDIKAGRVRLPRPVKRLLPSDRGDVEVSFRGQLMRARWDPKTEGPKERSGVLAFGRGKLDGLVKADEVLELRHERGGELQLR